MDAFRRPRTSDMLQVVHTEPRVHSIRVALHKCTDALCQLHTNLHCFLLFSVLQHLQRHLDSNNWQEQVTRSHTHFLWQDLIFCLGAGATFKFSSTHIKRLFFLIYSLGRSLEREKPPGRRRSIVIYADKSKKTKLIRIGGK